MTIEIKLSKIIMAMESQSDERRSYLNRETGEVFGVSEEELRVAEEEGSIEDYPEWQQELIETAKQVLEDEEGKFIALPSRFDIDEYSMMERFSLSVNDDEISDYLYAAIKGRGAFRQFKDEVRRFGLEEDWYKYRDEKFKELAIWWCEDNNIEYIDNL